MVPPIACRLTLRSSSFVRHGRRAHRHVRTASLAACAWPDPLEHARGRRAGGNLLQTEAMTPRRALRPALFWRVAIGNAAVLAAACTITALIFSPRASNVAVRELAIFAGGLLLMLSLLLLLRRAFAPLRQLTAFARRIDPLNPGPRVQV